MFQVKKLGMHTAYKKQRHIHTYIRELMALPNLPSEHIKTAFGKLKLRAPLGEHMESLRKLLKYFEKNWVENAKAPPASWSTYKRFIRTNNDCEGWHRKVNTRNTTDHPNMYILLETLGKEAADLPLQVRLVKQGKLMRRTRKDAASKQAHMIDLWERYEAKEFTVSEYLRECSVHLDHSEEPPAL